MSSLLESTLANFHYHLPKDRIAHQPAAQRDQSKLLLLDRQQQLWRDYHFTQLIELLDSNDLLVLNETKVFPARLLGKKSTGGKVELLLLKQLSHDTWQAIAKPGLKLKQRLFFPPRNHDPEEELDLADLLQAVVIKRDTSSAMVEVAFNYQADQLWQQIAACGLTPLPPYIHNQQSEAKRRQEYQTVYAKQTGSAAAPTAGLHFTEQLLEQLAQKGVQVEKLTLHVGLGTFAKLTEQNLLDQSLHEEYYQIEADMAARLVAAKAAGKRLIAVGTTTTRALESAVIADASGRQLKTGPQSTSLFIQPPYQFQVVDGLITNFHLPESSLLMMVSAFCSQPQTEQSFTIFKQSLLGQAYQHAISYDYRFFSFGDAMLIV